MLVLIVFRSNLGCDWLLVDKYLSPIWVKPLSEILICVYVGMHKSSYMYVCICFYPFVCVWIYTRKHVCAYPGTFQTQELPCGIRVADNPWPVKMAIDITSSGWPQGELFPWALKGQGLCDESHCTWFSLFSLLQASSPPPMTVANHWTTGRNSPAFKIQRLRVAGETNGWTIGMVYIS